MTSLLIKTLKSFRPNRHKRQNSGDFNGWENFKWNKDPKEPPKNNNYAKNEEEKPLKKVVYSGKGRIVTEDADNETEREMFKRSNRTKWETKARNFDETIKPIIDASNAQAAAQPIKNLGKFLAKNTAGSWQKTTDKLGKGVFAVSFANETSKPHEKGILETLVSKRSYYNDKGNLKNKKTS